MNRLGCYDNGRRLIESVISGGGSDGMVSSTAAMLNREQGGGFGRSWYVVVDSKCVDGENDRRSVESVE